MKKSLLTQIFNGGTLTGARYDDNFYTRRRRSVGKQETISDIEVLKQRRNIATKENDFKQGVFVHNIK